MQEAQTYIYHCNHCGQLFKSTGNKQTQNTCSHCGKNPLSPPFSNSVALQQKQPVSRSKTHGIPGKDEADFLSMQKKKKQKLHTLLFTLWFLGLIGISIFAYTYNKKNKNINRIANQDQFVSEQHLAKIQKTAKECYLTFIKFATADTIQSKSYYILNGSELILDINHHNNEKFSIHDIYRSRPISFNLVENDDIPHTLMRMRYTPVIQDKLEIEEVTDLTNVAEIEKDTNLKKIVKHIDSDESKLLNEDNESKTSETEQESIENAQSVVIDNSFEFEVVFWLQGDEWKVDWQHYVRLNATNWDRFCNNKALDTQKRFRLYARQVITESNSLDGYTEYKFTEALNNSRTPSQFPQSIFIKKDSPENKLITETFDSVNHSPLSTKKDPKKALKYFDPPNSIRIDVTLDHVTVEQETIAVVKKIHNFDWLTPPVKEN